MILSGGGTAGHIYPALALADELRSRDIELHYVGTAKGPEARLAKDADIDFTSIITAGFDRSKPWTLLTSGIKALWGVRQATGLLKEQRPAAVICFGGYVSVSIGLAARMRSIPLIVHEQNSHMGMTNHLLATKANLVALTYPETAGLPDDMEAQERFIGNPVRESVQDSDATRVRAEFNIPESAKILLVFGGSRGARTINRATLAALQQLLAALPDLHIIHGAGRVEYDSVVAGLDALCKQSPELEQLTSRYHVLPYIENMGDVLAAADLVVSRSGATSIAELTVLGKPSVLVPFPYATDDHQTTNAQALVDLGGARLIANDEMLDTGAAGAVGTAGAAVSADSSQPSSDTLGTNDKASSLFVDTLLELLQDDALRAQMAIHAKKLGKPDAAKELADAVFEIVDSD